MCQYYTIFRLLSTASLYGTNAAMNNSQRGEGLVSNILAIAGFIILIVIIIWGAFHFLNLASSGFSSLLNRAGASTIRVTAPRTATAGQPLDVSWQYTPSNTQGSYALLYQCKEGFQFRFPTASSTMAIPCGSPFAIGNPEAKTARLLPMLTGTQSADVALSIMYMTAGTSTPTTVAQGNASITIVSSTTTPATTGTGTTGGTGGTTGGTKTGTVTPVKPTTPVVTTP